MYIYVPKFYINKDYAMKNHFLLLWCALSLLLLSSFSNEKACNYAGSNVDYIKVQTQKALDSEDVATSRYFAYKALNAIEQSKSQFEDCGCDNAFKSIIEGLDNLKKATRVSSLTGTQMLLNRALKNILTSLAALEEHEEMHDSRYANDVLAINTKATFEEKMLMKLPVGKKLQEKIDSSLLSFQNSLERVVTTVDCKDAYIFASKIYDRCEQELLRPDLSEAKKYYNLRTKEITADALLRLEHCK